MTSTISTTARSWATRAVQWDPARNTLKRGAHQFARGRGLWLERSGRLPEMANIYTASPPRAGSQWCKALFDHPVVRARTGLFTLPQLDYQSDPGRGFPPGTYVPGMYLSYPEYRQVPHRHQHRLVYMFRDPRDIVVSGYFAAIGHGHRNTQVESVERERARMRELPLEEGLLEAVGAAATRLREMATWVGVVDENVATFRLEDIAASERDGVAKILGHCHVDLHDDEMDALMADISRAALQARDIAQRGDPALSHYRVQQRSYAEFFSAEHYAAVEAVVPGLAERLGYPPSPTA